MGTTAAKGLRYPEPTDRVADGALAMRHLAEDVDTGAGVLGVKVVDVGDKATSSQAPVAYDATCAVTFTAPPSGRVLVELEASTWIDQAGNAVYFEPLEGGANVGGTLQQVTGISGITRPTASFLVTGLAPGSSHTYTFGFAVNVGTVTGHVRGPAVIKVSAA